MIAKLEKAQSNAYQNRDKHKTLTHNGKYIKNRSTTTEPPPLKGQQSKLQWGIMPFYWRLIFALYPLVVITQTYLARM